MSANKEFSLDNQIYKVLTLEEWECAQVSGVIITDLDKKDGFIHLSSATQRQMPQQTNQRIVVKKIQKSTKERNLIASLVPIA